MKIHRFFVGEAGDRFGDLHLGESVWINDKALVNQWLRVLRLRSGEELVLFDGKGSEKLYKITVIEPASVKLQHITDMHVNIPTKHVHIAWAILKKDNNDMILQKCTELGVKHFHPVISERTEKTGFDIERARKIVIEAAEQCGRHDIPVIHESQPLKEFVGEYSAHMPVYIADMSAEKAVAEFEQDACVCIGPEGGWTDQERAFFDTKNARHLHLGQFTLRAETAVIVAARQLLF